ncbi:MAG TPA: ATP-binding cassette domain-containing protein [Candidatus Methylomirabilis sp.]|nr:ATP-binding cassette domain-containing protein [Candidatus Methylomirabilis sp.]
MGSLHDFLASADQITEVEDATAAGRGTLGVRVEVQRLNKFFGTHHVLRDLDLSVDPGETFVIFGPSGCGKSVLLKHIAGLLTPDSGRLLIDGEDLQAGEGRHRFRMAMVFQSSALFNSLSVGENVGLWLKEHRISSRAEIAKIVAEKLALVGLTGQEKAMPSELSGGMRKRVSIARALAVNPHLILYDEPTAGLDPVLTEQIGHVIVDLKKLKITSIVVTHDLNLGFHVAEHLGMIHEGRLIETGTPATIRATKNPVVRAFITTQTKILEGGG